MNSKMIQDAVYDYIVNNPSFTAPYGVLTGEHTSKKDRRRYLSVTFGRARTLDATVEIYNRNFILLRTSNEPTAEVFKDYDSLMQRLATI